MQAQLLPLAYGPNHVSGPNHVNNPSPSPIPALTKGGVYLDLARMVTVHKCFVLRNCILWRQWGQLHQQEIEAATCMQGLDTVASLQADR